MKHSDFLLLLDELLELPPHTLTADSLLEANGWSSLAVVGFIALADEQFGASVAPARMARCRTAGDLAALLSEYVLCAV